MKFSSYSCIWSFQLFSWLGSRLYNWPIETFQCWCCLLRRRLLLFIVILILFKFTIKLCLFIFFDIITTWLILLGSILLITSWSSLIFVWNFFIKFNCLLYRSFTLCLCKLLSIPWWFLSSNICFFFSSIFLLFIIRIKFFGFIKNFLLSRFANNFLLWWSTIMIYDIPFHYRLCTFITFFSSRTTVIFMLLKLCCRKCEITIQTLLGFHWAWMFR